MAGPLIQGKLRMLRWPYYLLLSVDYAMLLINGLSRDPSLTAIDLLVRPLSFVYRVFPPARPEPGLFVNEGHILFSAWFFLGMYILLALALLDRIVREGRIIGAVAGVMAAAGPLAASASRLIAVEPLVWPHYFETAATAALGVIYVTQRPWRKQLLMTGLVFGHGGYLLDSGCPYRLWSSLFGRSNH